MKIRVFSLLLLILVVAIGPVSAQTVDRKVVVNNFSVNGCSPELGTAASVALQTVLASYNDSGYKITKREVLNDLLAGSGLGLTSLISKKSARSLDVDFMIDGQLSQAGEVFSLNVYLAKAATQETIRSHTISAASVSELMAKLPKIALIILDISTAIAHEPLRLLPADDLTYNSWYSDANGVHKGGKIVLHVDGEEITGTSIESYGQAKMSGRIQGNLLIGIYEASYGYGNFEFEIREQGEFIKGTYYQVSNGANGEWSGRLQ